MRWALSLIVTILLMGCGKKAPQKPIGLTSAELSALEKKYPDAFVNSLGMVFKSVPGTGVAFCIWETRVKDYAFYAAANAEVDGDWKSLGFKQENTHPVVKMSWNDAQAFCVWLTKMELAAGRFKQGQEYRLPTDAEWSVAVGLDKEKGNTPFEKNEGIKDVYPWGEEWPPPKGAGNYIRIDDFKHTAPVGSFAANQFGLYDMGGNVWEWCEDDYYPANGHKERVLRGTSWYNVAPFGSELSSFRASHNAGMTGTDFGFRVVLASE